VNVNSFNKGKDSADVVQDGGYSVKTELYFGLVKPDGTIVGEAEWVEFADKSISPLFPYGFTILDAAGQSKDHKGSIASRKTKMLLVVQARYNKASVGKIKEEFSKAFPGNPFFNVSYQVSSPLDKESGGDADGDGD